MPHDRLQVLLHVAEAFPWILAKPSRPLARGTDVIVAAALELAELGPAQRHRDRRALARAQGIIGDAGGTAAVAKVIDEDASAPDPLGGYGDEFLRMQF